MAVPVGFEAGDVILCLTLCVVLACLPLRSDAVKLGSIFNSCGQYVAVSGDGSPVAGRGHRPHDDVSREAAVVLVPVGF